MIFIRVSSVSFIKNSPDARAGRQGIVMAFDASAYATQYQRDFYHRFQVLIPKEKTDAVKQIAAERGLTVSQAFCLAFEKAYGVKISL